MASDINIDVYRAKNKDKIQKSFDESKRLLMMVLPENLILKNDLEIFPLGYIKGKSIVSEDEIGTVVSGVVKLKSFNDVYVLSAVRFINSGRVVFLLRPAAFVKRDKAVFSLDLGYPYCGLAINDKSKLEEIVNNLPLSELYEVKAKARWRPLVGENDLKDGNNSEQSRGYLPPLILGK